MIEQFQVRLLLLSYSFEISGIVLGLQIRFDVSDRLSMIFFFAIRKLAASANFEAILIKKIILFVCFLPAVKNYWLIHLSEIWRRLVIFTLASGRIDLLNSIAN